MSQNLSRAATTTVAAKALKPALMAAGLILVAAALPLVGDGAAQTELTTTLAQGGLRGQSLFLLLATLLTAIGLPRQIPAFAAGYAFGPVYGSAIALIAQVLACSLDFIWARAIGQSFVRRRFGARLERIDRTLSAHPFITTLTLRLMPIGNNLLLNLLAGLTSVRLLPFLAGSAIGFIPQTVVFALFGKGSAPSHAHLLILGLAMFTASAALGILIFRRARPTA
ncbi:TVP38/TMEM64 family protein [Acidocella sp. KAb 2-4]|uniref:TVP38/TMEM64 family protein n=1 Tax=Acidocella sp. KAb 2-4 TaxID=2885158 RepID=UPI001D074EF5|nr:VTT domain-containing protein [Acidocella sp. KAb 2-4]MCB5945759.1 VTT domain-containing protein [Acidocella sp. KAb 2-4]